MGALIAPRPFLIESGGNDIYSGERRLQNVNEQVDITKGAYKLFGKEDNLHLYTFEGPHRWNSEIPTILYESILYIGYNRLPAAAVSVAYPSLTAVPDAVIISIPLSCPSTS